MTEYKRSIVVSKDFPKTEKALCGLCKHRLQKITSNGEYTQDCILMKAHHIDTPSRYKDGKWELDIEVVCHIYTGEEWTADD